MDDLIKRQDAITAYCEHECGIKGMTRENCGATDCGTIFDDIPSAQPEEVIPHRNYKYLLDYWCECGWHLGKKGEVKYCADCGRKVKWDD